MKRVVLRSLGALFLLPVCAGLFPSWLGCCYDLPSGIRSDEFEIAPLMFLSDFSFILIFPLGLLGLIAFVLPSWLIRLLAIVGAASCFVMIAHFLLPHEWHVSPFPDPFYKTYWEEAKKQADEGRSDEHIVYYDKGDGPIIFYVKGFGISGAELFFVLVCATPGGIFLAEILLRRGINNANQSPRDGTITSRDGNLP